MLLQADCMMSHIKDRVLIVAIFLVATAALKGNLSKTKQQKKVNLTEKVTMKRDTVTKVHAVVSDMHGAVARAGCDQCCALEM